MSAIGGKADVRELPSECPLIAISGHLAVAAGQRKAPPERGVQELFVKRLKRGSQVAREASPPQYAASTHKPLGGQWNDTGER